MNRRSNFRLWATHGFWILCAGFLSAFLPSHAADSIPLGDRVVAHFVPLSVPKTLAIEMGALRPGQPVDMSAITLEHVWLEGWETQGGVLHDGRLWIMCHFEYFDEDELARTARAGLAAEQRERLLQARNMVASSCRLVLFSVDLQTLQSEVHPAPARLTAPESIWHDLSRPYHASSDPKELQFACLGEHIYVLGPKRLLRYHPSSKTWEEWPVLVSEPGRLVVASGRLFLSTSSSIQEVIVTTRTVKLLASLRRRPPANPLDELEALDKVPLWEGTPGEIRTFAGNRVYRLNQDGRGWEPMWALPESAPGTQVIPWNGGVLCVRGDSARIYAITRDADRPELLVENTRANLGPAGVEAIRRRLPLPPRAKWQPPDRPVPREARGGVSVPTFSMSVPLSPALPHQFPLYYDGTNLLAVRIWNMFPGFSETHVDPLHEEDTLLYFSPQFGTSAMIPLRFDYTNSDWPERSPGKFHVFVVSHQQVAMIASPVGMVLLRSRVPGFWIIRQDEFVAALASRTNGLPAPGLQAPLEMTLPPAAPAIRARTAGGMQAGEEQFDADKDGFLDAWERADAFKDPAYFTSQLSQIDRNGDGFIEPSEWNSYNYLASNPTGAQDEPGQTIAALITPRLADELLHKADLDSNGGMSRAELQAALDRYRQLSPEQRATYPPYYVFETADKNGDGQVDRAEIQEKMMEGVSRQNPRPLSPPMTTYDVNQDGKLNREEYTAFRHAMMKNRLLSPLPATNQPPAGSAPRAPIRP